MKYRFDTKVIRNKSIKCQPNLTVKERVLNCKVIKMNNASHHILAAFLCQKLTPLHCSTFRHIFRHHIRRKTPNAGGHNPIKEIKSVNNLITSEILVSFQFRT